MEPANTVGSDLEYSWQDGFEDVADLNDFFPTDASRWTNILFFPTFR